MNKLLKCGKCGHYHFALSKEEIASTVKAFWFWAKDLSEDQIQEYYGGELKEPSFEKCFCCGAEYTEMLQDDGQCPLGVTLQGIQDV